jgi:serine/threonine protein kinase
LVKPVQAEADAVSTMLAGTPMYMAPERLRDLRSNDIRSDIYSWGAVGFYLLTGRDIFADDSSQSLLERIMFDTPPLASECVSEPIPHELDQLIADCLAKDLETRPQSMQEVLKRLHGETQLLDLRPT